MGKKRRRTRKPKASGRAERAEAIYRSILELYDDRRAARTGSAASGLADHLDLRVRVHLRPAERADAARAFGRDLLAEIDRVVEGALEAERSFHEGRVYCYWCESAECEHAAPPGSKSVFNGYGPTGVPLWSDFASVCLNTRDPRIDLLYRERPEPFAIVQPGEVLKAAQLGVFGARSPIYRIVAQLVAGYLPLRLDGERVSVAFTVQAVRSAFPGRAPRLGLNVIGQTPSGADLAPILAENPDDRLARILDTGRRRIEELALRAGRRRLPRREIDAVIRHLANGIERLYRQRSRRTKHGEGRHLDRNRPAATALRDARSAPPERFYRDGAEGTIVVVGPKNRVHVFSASGRHVTSVTYAGRTIGRRISSKKWKPLPAAERELFLRAAVGPRGDGEATEERESGA